MSKEVWFWSDLHLGHANMYSFTNYDGTPTRPWTPEQMQEAEEYMLQEYNKLVKAEDTVYFLGDISSRNSVANKFFSRLNKSRRILIAGNHDNKLGAKFWLKHFNDVRGCYNLESYIMTHIPISSGSKGRFKRNVHGHTHGNFITVDDNGKIRDYWYRNVCVEVIGYKPINFSEIKEETEKLIEKGIIIIPKKGERIV